MNSVRFDPPSRSLLLDNLLRPLAPFMEKDGVTEIFVNRAHEVFIEVGPTTVRHHVPALSHTALLSIAQAVATYCNDEIGASKPILSAMLPGGERIQIVVPPAVEAGEISITIRIPDKSIRSLDEYASGGFFNRYIWPEPEELDERRNDISHVDRMMMEALKEGRLMQFLLLAIQAKKNIAVVGDTGSGKTSLMKSLCQTIQQTDRLITIEDVRELFLDRHENRVHLMYQKGRRDSAAISPSDLISACMRMKPSRVLLAELRGSEAFDFLKLLTTGHSGSVTSFHAESCALAFERYVFMCKEHADAATYDESALKRLVTLTIDIIIHVVAENIYSESGEPIRKDRYVTEVHFNPVAKLNARFNHAHIHHAGSES